ncbi:extracellular solute-binding protein [Nocardioides sp. CPCC 206347]|uniref:extracellular solute-binding protein n=1 Tax=unclassified Nocardioides TaxID=2615069 RepID=UPI003610AB15
MTRVSRFDWRTGAVVGVVAVAVLIGMLVLASGSKGEKPEHPVSTKPTMTNLEFAVWGNKAEVAAYQGVVDDYNASSKDTNVALTSWPDSASMLLAMRTGVARPDLYLLPRGDLAETIAEKRNLPLLDLLNEREIPVGEDFSRDAIEAFSVDDDLQCMPYTTSPMVMYYNTDLVDFEAMAAEGLPTPKDDHSGWNFAEFRAAAEFASRPRLKTRGVYIEPTLRGLAPFIYSGGGKIFDGDEPKSLSLGEDDSTDALRQTLELLRDPRLTLTTRQLEQRSAVDWFKRGRLAMIAGFRSLTPDLRAVEGLNFDVMPMPSLGANHTVGEQNGICLAPGSPARAESSANFLSYLVSDEAVARVAETGYIQPSKLTVALSKDFLQPDLAPAHAVVFNNVVRSIVLPPLMTNGAELQALITPDIKGLLTTPVLTDLQELLRAIDEKSRTLLDPDYEPSEEPSDDPSSTASSSASGTASDGATDDRSRN